MKPFIEAIGWISAIFTIIAYCPQTYRVWKTKNTASLSKWTFSMVFVGAFFFVIFAIFVNNWQSLVTNAIVAYMMILIGYYLFNRDKRLLISTLVILTIVSTLAIILIALNLGINEIAGTIFSFIASFIISIPFIFQTIKIIQDKKVGEFSLSSAYLIIWVNALWTLYWTLVLAQSYNSAVLVALIFVIIGLGISIWQVFVYYRFRVKSH